MWLLGFSGVRVIGISEEVHSVFAKKEREKEERRKEEVHSPFTTIINGHGG